MKKKKEHIEVEKVKIGSVGVDSGQILICDPCYIDYEWIREEFDVTRPVEVKWAGTTHYIDMSSKIAAGHFYNSPFDEFGGMTMNELLSSGKARELPLPETGRFSYNGCCRATLSEKQCGRLNYKMGHEGVGMAVRTGHGDGFYPVYVKYGKNGRVKSVEVVFE